MPIRSCCGYYDFGKLRNLLKMVPNLGRASLHAYLQSWNGRSVVGTGLSSVLTDECQDAF